MKEAISGKLLFVLVVLLSFLAISPATLNAQEFTLDNYSGSWLDDASWESGTCPGTTNLQTGITVNGFITSSVGLDINKGDLVINDTLIIFGDLSFGNNGNLIINTGGILIVYGNYSSDNKVDVLENGIMVVTGEFTMQNNNNQGSFQIDSGSVYIFDPVPQIKDGVNFSDLQCNPDCGYGDSTALSSDPIFDFFKSGGYTISASGPLSFCAGGSVDLSVPDEGLYYQ
ncbi:MAG TPA: hypothetical protein VE870_04710, partial [Bacteroidales bacterium]|nr:hypothetical protein [Bacteroidales bacterium]